MSRTTFGRPRIIAIALAALLTATPALAEKPDHAGGGKQGGKPDHAQGQSSRAARGPDETRDRARGAEDERGRRPAHEAGDPRNDRDERADRDNRGDRDYRDDRRQAPREHRYFEDRQRSVVRKYYADEYRRGQCPPGLAKKRNGCMPPGLAKQWRIGERLPRDVVYYDLPRALLIDLGPAPHMHKYVRVGADILLIAIGTGLIVDALEDLNSR